MGFTAIFLSILIVSTVEARPHLDLDTTAAEYRQLLKKDNKNKSFKNSDPEIQFAIRLGERLYQWIEAINQTRSADNQLRITSPENRRKYPIDAPAFLNVKAVAIETEKNLNRLPPEILAVLLSEVEFPIELSVDDKTFASLTLPVEQNYRDAARFRSLIKWKDDYILDARKDVLGYHYLVSNDITSEDLREASQVSEETRRALVKICRNDFSETIKTCTQKVAQASRENRLGEHFEKYFPVAEAIWNQFFKIPKNEVRKDISWTTNGMIAPFRTPEHERFIPFLRDNIEDEFRWGDWQLKMVFGDFTDAPFLKFVPGTTPHVPVGNNMIVMDANQSIDEYDTQWVIRHEYGHILGLPDCYHEFYDEELGAFVSYQLDVKDLMCSRAGNMTERIYSELKEVYSK